ncbi:MAG: cytochrome c biogenesis protein ResB [Lentisphaerae bacterium]|nr:cytochrome c biogenesis protein ResB [Lentisphaerota bacterium]
MNEPTMTAPSTGILSGIVRLLASYGLCIVLLCFLLLLTLLGTLEQAEVGLFAAQEKYFNSAFLIHRFFDLVPVPLPGVYLLLVLLFVNVTLGSLLRRTVNRRSIGMLIAHGGILVLLIGGYVAFHYSMHGSLQMYEKQSSDEFESYQDYVVEIRRLAPAPSERAWLIPTKTLESIGSSGTRTFTSADLPFDVILSQYLVNCRPVPGGQPPALPPRDGVALQPLARDPEVERNLAGVYIDVAPKAGGSSQGSILWGMERAPYTFQVGAERWSATLTHRKWRLPFTVYLDDFTVEWHPNTRMPRVYRSDITKIEGESREAIKISMNAPLRHRGYTLFQASWGPQNAAPGTPLFSGFAVVHNPADNWPLYACIIVSIGMLIHFLQKLYTYLKRRAAS